MVDVIATYDPVNKRLIDVKEEKLSHIERLKERIGGKIWYVDDGVM